MAIEIVDLSMKHGDFPQLFVCLPEASSYNGDILLGEPRNKLNQEWDANGT